jgi:hypothetical protein
MKILFRAYFHQKNFQKKVGRKFIRVRIRTFSKVGSGSGQKSSGSATLCTSFPEVKPVPGARGRIFEGILSAAEPATGPYDCC